MTHNKRFVKSDDIVRDAIDGLIVRKFVLYAHDKFSEISLFDALQLSSPNLARFDAFPTVKVVVQRQFNRNNVQIISGGGSGHEPVLILFRF